MNVINILNIVLWFFLIPTCCGMLLTDNSKKGFCSYMGDALLNGVIIMIALFQTVYLFFVLFFNHFTVLVYSYLAIVILFSLFALSVSRRKVSDMGFKHRNGGKRTLPESILWIIFLLLFVFQLVMTITYSYPDGDDSFYTVTSLITTTNDTMYINLPYTGETSDLDKRHAFSSAPIMLAFFSRVCHIHPTILSNTVFSAFVIILMYVLYKNIAEILCKKKESVPIFLIIISLLYLFGNSSIYTDTTFLLTRTGQGKAFLANIIPAAIFYGLLKLSKNMGDSENNSEIVYIWSYLSCVMIVSGYTSTMGLFIGPFLTGIGYGVLLLYFKRWNMIKGMLLTFIPIGMMGVIYIGKLYL